MRAHPRWSTGADQEERIAEFVRLGIVAAISTTTAMVSFMVAEAIARQMLENVSQRFLSDLRSH